MSETKERPSADGEPMPGEGTWRDMGAAPGGSQDAQAMQEAVAARSPNAKTEPMGSRIAIRALGAGRVLAFAGALLFAVAAWLPWASVSVSSDADPLAPTSALLLDPGGIGAPPLPAFYQLGAAFVVWSTLSVLGVLLAALLWLGARPLSAFATWLGHATWLLLVSFIAARSAMALLRPGEYTLHVVADPGAPSLAAQTLTVHGAQPGIGIPVAGLALVLSWIGGILVVLAGARGLAHRRVFAAETVSPRSAPGRWVLLVGLVGWAFGFLQMAWAGLDCGMPILGGGTCVGLSGTDALRYMLGGTVAIPLPGSSGGVIVGVDPRAALYAIPTALIGVALLLAIALWRRATSPAIPIWTALWLLAASGFAILAQWGVREVVADAPALGLPAGAWQGAAGIYVTLASLVLVLAGLAMRWLSPHVSRAHQLQPA